MFPDDSAADLANICSKLNSFTNKQLNKAFERFELWSGKKINEEQILNSLKIETVEQTKLNWNGLVETDFKYWENKFDKTMNKVGFRLTL